MCSRARESKPITPPPTPPPPHPKFIVENLTVARPPLLKVYYWEFFDIDGLNEKLQTEEDVLLHHVHIPVRQINSKSLKIIFWLRNISTEMIVLRLKRIKNCDCVPLETRVGFNQFRQMYHCPHRRLLHITQELIRMQPEDLVAMSVITNFFLFGEHQLSFEVNCANRRVLVIHFHLDVIGFDPQKCVLTKTLIPLNISEYRRMVQPIWVRNITMQNLQFSFSTKERGLRLINPNLIVPRQSVWPLMVEYRPSDIDNDLEISLGFDSVKTKFSVKAEGITGEVPDDGLIPIEDVECVDFLYVVYPNKLNFDVQQQEERSQMVAVINNNQTCLEFHWQSYVINDLFEIRFEPSIFRLKPHHIKLCVVNLTVHRRPLHFKRIPTVLEIHRIFDRSTKIAQELLAEIESIDDPKWKEDSYIEHVFLHLNLHVNYLKENRLILKWEPPLPKKERMHMPLPPESTTIFETLFWEYLSKSHFMRENDKPHVSDELNFDEVLELYAKPPEIQPPLAVNRNGILNIVSQLLAEGLREISKSWRFIPRELLEADS